MRSWKAKGMLPKPVHCGVRTTRILVGLTTGRWQNRYRVVVKRGRSPMGPDLHSGNLLSWGHRACPGWPPPCLAQIWGKGHEGIVALEQPLSRKLVGLKQSGSLNWVGF